MRSDAVVVMEDRGEDLDVVYPHHFLGLSTEPITWPKETKGAAKQRKLLQILFSHITVNIKLYMVVT